MEEYNAGVPIDLGKLDGTWRLQYTSAPDVLVLLESAARFSFFQVLQLKYKIMFFLFWTFYSLLFTFFFLFVLIIQDDGNWPILHILSVLTMKGFCWKLPCMKMLVCGFAYVCVCFCLFWFWFWFLFWWICLCTQNKTWCLKWLLSSFLDFMLSMLVVHLCLLFDARQP